MLHSVTGISSANRPQFISNSEEIKLPEAFAPMPIAFREDRLRSDIVVDERDAFITHLMSDPQELAKRFPLPSDQARLSDTYADIFSNRLIRAHEKTFQSYQAALPDEKKFYMRAGARFSFRAMCGQAFHQACHDPLTSGSDGDNLHALFYFSYPNFHQSQLRDFFLNYTAHPAFTDPCALVALFCSAEQLASVRHKPHFTVEVAPGLYVGVKQGSHESVFGTDFFLYGMEIHGTSKHIFYAATAGIVRNKHGYDLLNLQGGFDLGRTNIATPEGEKNLLRQMQLAFGNDPLVGFGNYVMQLVDRHSPQAKWRMLRGDHMSWFVHYLWQAEQKTKNQAPYFDEPLRPRNIYNERCDAALEKLQRRLQRARSPGQSQKIEKTINELIAAKRGAARHDLRAEKLGFRAQPDSPWLVLPRQKAPREPRNPHLDRAPLP